MFEYSLTSSFVFLNIFCISLKSVFAFFFLPTITLENILPNSTDSTGIILNKENLPDDYFILFSNVVGIINIYYIISIVVYILNIWTIPNFRSMWISIIISVIINISLLVTNLAILYVGDYTKIFKNVIFLYWLVEILTIFPQSIFSMIMCCLADKKYFYEPLYNPEHKIIIIPYNG